MKITELHLDEIERLHKSDYEGGKGALYDKQSGKQIKKLPGGSGLLYSTSENRYGGIDIKLWDRTGADYVAAMQKENEPKPVRKRGEGRLEFYYRQRDWERSNQDRNAPGQLIGKLSVSAVREFPLKGAVQVDTITVDEDYRGVGLAKALYGIVLTVLKRPLLAGSSQTPGGRKNWVSLASIPGVEMKGYFGIDPEDIDPAAGRSRFSSTTPSMANKNIDVIMGQLGGQYMGKSWSDFDYFSFDVRPTTTGAELEAVVKTKMSKIYNSSDGGNDVGLYAVWTGQQ